jgi:DinB family protein
MATQEQVDELVTKMREQRAELLAAARSLSAEDALRVPVDAEGEEQWTALEQLAHLWEMERSYDSWVKQALREDNPTVTGALTEPVDIPVEEANQHTVAELVRALEMERAYTHGLIDALRLEDFDRTATSQVFGTLSGCARSTGTTGSTRPRSSAGKATISRTSRVGRNRTSARCAWSRWPGAEPRLARLGVRRRSLRGCSCGRGVPRAPWGRCPADGSVHIHARGPLSRRHRRSIASGVHKFLSGSA